MRKSTPKESEHTKKKVNYLSPSQKTINNILLFASTVQVEKITDGPWLHFFLN